MNKFLCNYVLKLHIAIQSIDAQKKNFSGFRMQFTQKCEYALNKTCRASLALKIVTMSMLGYPISVHVRCQ